MRKLSKAGKVKPWLMKYTVTFIVVFLVACSLQIYYGKSFVYSERDLGGDGLVIHYLSLAYLGNWLRNIANNIFVNHSFSIPEFDLSIRFGEDIISTLNFYVLGDPLNLLSIFVPARHTEFLYNALVVLRLYLAGITFYLYCLYHSYESDQILPGVMIYVFSFYTIVIAVLHPYFLNPLIYFPLVLLGIDKVLKERKPLLFIGICAISAASSFYFFYMMTVLMVIYGGIRYVQYHSGKLKCSLVFQELGRFALYYAIGVMIAAPIFLPSAAAVLGSSRVGTGGVAKIYELIYYAKLPIAFMNASADHYSAMGYGAVGVLAVLLLFFRTKWKEKIGFKIAFLLGTLFLLFPFFGHLLNGFGYATNRWIWGYCFVVSLIVVEMFREVMALPVFFKWLAAGITILFMIPTFGFRAKNKTDLLVATVVLVVFSVILAIAILICKQFEKGTLITYVVMITVNVFLSMFSFYSPYSGNDIERHGNLGSAYTDLMSGPLSALEGLENEELARVRVDTSNLGFSGVRANSAMLYDVNSISAYFSVLDAGVTVFLHDLWLPTPFEHRYADLDSRAMLEAMMGVRYNIVREDEGRYLPYGFERRIADRNGYSVYETEYRLPMAVVYEAAISEDEYRALAPLRKQQALLQTAVISQNCLEDKNFKLAAFTSKELQFQDTISDYVFEEKNGLEISQNGIKVLQPGAFITLNTNSVRNAERYVSFENLWFEGKQVLADITITDGIRSKCFRVTSDLHAQYANVHNFLCNLGYAEEHGENYKIIFSEPGVYTWSSMEILNQPLGNMDEQIRELEATNVEYFLGEDSVLLCIEADRDSLLYASIPYSKGWEAFVDGEKTEIVKTNNLGMGFFMTPGKHRVELVYHTPYLRLGLILMVVGIIGCIIGIRLSGASMLADCGKIQRENIG